MTFSQARIAVMSNGDIAQVVLSGSYPAVRWHSQGSWSYFQQVCGSGYVDVAVSAAIVEGVDTAFICVTSGREAHPAADGLEIYTLTAGGKPVLADL